MSDDGRAHPRAGERSHDGRSGRQAAAEPNRSERQAPRGRDEFAELLQRVRACGYLDVLGLRGHPAPGEVAEAAASLRQLVAKARQARRHDPDALDEVALALDDAEAVLSDAARAEVYVRHNPG